MTKQISLILSFTLLLITSCRLDTPISNIQTTRSVPDIPQSPSNVFPHPTVTETLFERAPERPVDAIKITAHDVYPTFCSYKTHTVQITQQTYSLLDYEGCFSRNPAGEYIQKRSWWDSYEILKPHHSSFTWWRYAPGEDWSPAPLEYHDPISSDIAQVVNAVYELEGWQITEDNPGNGENEFICWHYHYQGPFELLPSNQFSHEEVEKKDWDSGFVNHLQADLWIHPEGYLVKELIQWDVRFTFSDGSTAKGKEKIASGLRNINQDSEIPELIVPPVPASLTSPWLGKWLEYGDPQGIWKYQLGKPPKEIQSIYIQSETEGYVILDQKGDPEDGYTLTIQSSDGTTWEIIIQPKAGTKGGTVSLLIMQQE